MVTQILVDLGILFALFFIPIVSAVMSASHFVDPF